MPDEREPPWKERWSLSGCHWGMWPNEVEDEAYWRHNDARMRLAERAPEMARLLLDYEWLGHDEGGYDCRSCGAHKNYGDDAAKHDPGCEWLALMKHAGVR